MNPLDQLADITPPQTIDIWPLAYGYWLSLIVIVLLVVLAATWLIKRNSLRKTRNQAIKHIKHLSLENADFCFEVHVILKQTLNAYFVNDNVLQKTSKQWAELLQAYYQGQHSEKVNVFAEHIYARLYKKDNSESEDCLTNEEVKAIAIDWIRTSLPPLKSRNANRSSNSVTGEKR